MSEAEHHRETERLYVVHLKDSLLLANSQQGRVMTINMVLSVALLALATGFVSAGDTVTIFGIEFELSVSTLMAGGAIVSATLFMITFALNRRRHALEAAVWRRYRDLGIQKPVEKFFDPFSATSTFEAAIPTTDPTEHKIRSIGNVIGHTKFTLAVHALEAAIFAIAFIGFPVLAQVSAVGAVIYSMSGERPWIWTLLLIPVLSVLSALVALFEEQRPREETFHQ